VSFFLNLEKTTTFGFKKLTIKLFLEIIKWYKHKKYKKYFKFFFLDLLESKFILNNDAGEVEDKVNFILTIVSGIH